jgi:hypothetical protein
MWVEELESIRLPAPSIADGIKERRVELILE